VKVVHSDAVQKHSLLGQRSIFTTKLGRNSPPVSCPESLLRMLFYNIGSCCTAHGCCLQDWNLEDKDGPLTIDDLLLEIMDR